MAHVQAETKTMNTLVIPITYECNLHCPWCTEKNTHTTKGSLTQKHIDTILNHISDNKDTYQKTTFQGGEPLLYPELIDLLTKEITKLEPKMEYQLYTNATQLTFPILETIHQNKINIITSIEAEGYKGLTNLIKHAKDPDNIFTILNNIPTLTNRMIILRNTPFAHSVLLLHSLLPDAQIETVLDYTTLSELTEQDLANTKKELNLLPRYPHTWYTFMQQFTHKCTSTATWYESTTSTFRERCPAEQRPANGCKKMQTMKPDIYNKFITL